jgi:hypothetical protein
LGHSPDWYKLVVLSSLALNPIIQAAAGNEVCSWFVLAEFIFTLAMALQAYPLQAGGLLVIESNLLGLTNPHTLYHEVEVNLPVILMVIFMVACIHFLKNMLLWVFTNMLLKVKGKVALSVLFLLLSAVMSAFLDALTVSAVVVSVCTGFLGVYYHVVKNCALPIIRQHRHDEMEFELPKVAERRSSEGLPPVSASDIVTNLSGDIELTVVPHEDYSCSQSMPAMPPPSKCGDGSPSLLKRRSSLVNPDGTEYSLPTLDRIMSDKISLPVLHEDAAEGEGVSTLTPRTDAEIDEVEDNISRFKVKATPPNPFTV